MNNMGNHNCQTTFVGGINPFLSAVVDKPDATPQYGIYPKARAVERLVIQALAKRSPETISALAKQINVSRATCRSALYRLANAPKPTVAVVKIGMLNKRPVHFYGLVS